MNAIDRFLDRLNVPDAYRRFAILAAAGLVFLVLGFVLTVKPVLNRVEYLRSAAGNAKERSRLILDIHRLKQEAASLDQLLSNEKDRHLILGEITTLANQSSLDINSLVPTTVSEGNFVRLSLAMTGSGSFRSLSRFLEVLEETKPSIAVVSLNIASNRGGWESPRQIMGIDLVLETYLRKGK